MAPTNDAVHSYIAAVSTLDADRLASLGQWLADDVVVAGPVGPAIGKAQAVEALSAPNATRLVANARWSDPRDANGELVVDALAAPGMAIGGVRFYFAAGPDGRLTRVEQELIPAAPPQSQPLSITPEMTALINDALANGTPFVVSYVDGAGVPHISPRGSVQVFSEQQLAVWARDPQGGLPRAVTANPHLALYYRDPKARVSITVVGRARITEEPADRDAIFERQPAIERNFDGRRRGVAIIVDVDQLDFAGPGGRSAMVRQ